MRFEWLPKALLQCLHVTLVAMTTVHVGNSVESVL